MLRARRSRQEDYVGSWLPEPIVSLDEEADPEQEAMLADSVGLALLVVLETLTPAERLAFVLHDMFGVPFDEIAPIVDRTPDAARQLASRARRRVRGAAPNPDADLARQREIVDAFLAAARSGDFDALLAVLDPDVVFRIDAGAQPARPAADHRRARRRAPDPLARRRASRRSPARRSSTAPPGSSSAPADRPFAVVGFTFVHGRIVAIDIITDPDKLDGLVIDA